MFLSKNSLVFAVSFKVMTSLLFIFCHFLIFLPFTEVPPLPTVVLIFQTIRTFVDQKPKYKKVLNEAGLLNVLAKLISDLSVDYEPKKQEINVQINFEEQVAEITKKGEKGKISSERLGGGMHESLMKYSQEERIVLFNILADTISVLLNDSPSNVLSFKISGPTNSIKRAVWSKERRSGALRVLYEMAMNDAEVPKCYSEYVTLFSQIIQSKRQDYVMAKEVLNVMRRLFVKSDQLRNKFCDAGGFLTLFSLLTAMENYFVEQNDYSEGLLLVIEIFKTFTVVIASSPANRKIFGEQIVFGIASGLRLIKLPQTVEMKLILDELFDLCCERVSFNSTDAPITPESIIHNPQIVIVLLDLAYFASYDQKLNVFYRLLQLCSSHRNREALSKAHTIDFLLERYKNFLLNPSYESPSLQPPSLLSSQSIHSNELSSSSKALAISMESSSKLETGKFGNLVIEALVTLASHKLSVSESQKLLRLMRKHNFPTHLIEALIDLDKRGRSPPLVEMNMSETGYASMKITKLPPHISWPPSNGFTLLFWLFIDSFGSSSSSASLSQHNSFSPSKNQEEEQVVELCSITSKTSSYLLQFFVEQNGRLSVKIALKNKRPQIIQFPVTLQSKRWFHLGFIHSKNRFSASQLSLYVNGVHYGTEKALYVYNSDSEPVFFFGTPSSSSFPSTNSLPSSSNSIHTPPQIGTPPRVSNQRWKLGPLYLVDEIFTQEMIATIYFLGFDYSANFRAPFSPYQTWEVFNASNLNLALSKFNPNLDIEFNKVYPLFLQNASFTVSPEKIIFSFTAKNYCIEISKPLPPLPPTSHPLSAQVTQAPLLSKASSFLSSSSLSLPVEQNDAKRSRSQFTKETYKIINSVASEIASVSLTTNASYFAVLEEGARPYLLHNFSTLLRRIGGMSVLFYFLSHSNSSNFASSLHLLVQCIQHNHWNTLEMEQPFFCDYENLAYILKQKSSLIDFKSMTLLWSLVGVPLSDFTLLKKRERELLANKQKGGKRGEAKVNQKKEEGNEGRGKEEKGDEKEVGGEMNTKGVIGNISAFEHIFINYQIWQSSPISLQKLFFKVLTSLITENQVASYNLQLFEQLGSKLTFFLFFHHSFFFKKNMTNRSDKKVVQGCCQRKFLT